MPASITISNAVPYAGNYQSFRSPVQNSPPGQEGPRTIPVSFLWSSDAVAPNFAVNIDLRNQRNLNISQICSLYVDNLSSDADVFFYFPDTQTRASIPADSVGLVPVVTNGVQFVAYSPDATDGDQTFVQVMNFNPPPFGLTKTQFQTPEAAAGVALPTSVTPTNTTIYTGAGTLRGIQIYVTNAEASAVDLLQIELRDGVGGAILYTNTVQIPTTAPIDISVASLVGLEVPFANGVVLNLIDTGGHITQGAITVNTFISHK